MTVGPSSSDGDNSGPAALSLGTIITFYSYKGGVGRSMALANIAAVLALEGKRVLVVDWDLEAPGLEKYLDVTLDERDVSREPPTRALSVGGYPEMLQPGARRSGLRARRTETRGLLDMLVAWRTLDERTRSSALEQPELPEPLSWRSCVLEAFPFQNERPVHLITAGKESPAYAANVQSIDWTSLFERNDVGAYLEKLRDQWRASYDFVLIDSRTGLSDSGAVCTALLPDQLVVLFTANEQSVEGVLTAVRGAQATRSVLPVERKRLVVIPVPSRDEPYAEKKLSDLWRKVYADKLADLFRMWLPEGITPADALSRLSIPYQSYWSFGERLPVLERIERETPARLGAAYVRLAKLLGSGLRWEAFASEGVPLDIKRAEAKAQDVIQQARNVERELVEARERAVHEAELARTRRRRYTLLASAAAAVLFVLALGGVLWTSLSRAREDQHRAEDVAIQREREAADMRVQLQKLQQAQAEAEKTRKEARAREVATLIASASDPRTAEQYLDELRALLPANDPRLDGPMVNVVGLWLDQSRNSKVPELPRQAAAMEDLARSIGDTGEPGKVRRWKLLRELASAYSSRRFYNDAIRLLQEVAADAKKAGDASEGDVRRELAATFAQAGRTGEAVHEYDAVVERQRTEFGEDSDQYVSALGAQGRFLFGIGQSKRAEETLRHAIELTEKKYRAEYPGLIPYLEDYSKVLNELGEGSRAIEISRRADRLKSLNARPEAQFKK